MGTWEQRMSEQAATRQKAATEAAEEALRTGRGLPHDGGLPAELDNEHNRHLWAGHHWHVVTNYTVCSCGQQGGCWTVSVDPRYWSDDPAEQAQAQREDEDFRNWIECDVCGQRGVMNDEHFGVWPPRAAARSGAPSA